MPAPPPTAGAHRGMQRRRPRPRSRGVGNASAGPSTHMKKRQVRTEETQTLASLKSDNRFAVLEPTQPAPDAQEVRISPPRSEFTFTLDHRKSKTPSNLNRRRPKNQATVSVPEKIVLAPPIFTFPCSKQSSTLKFTPLPFSKVVCPPPVTQTDWSTTQKGPDRSPAAVPTADTTPVVLRKADTTRAAPLSLLVPALPTPQQQPNHQQSVCSPSLAHVQSVLSSQPPVVSPILSPSSLGDLTISSFPPSPSPRLSPPAPTTADRESRFFPSTSASSNRLKQISVAAEKLATYQPPSPTVSTSSKNDYSRSASPPKQQARLDFGRNGSPERKPIVTSTPRANSLDEDSGYVSWVSDNVSGRNSSESENGEGEAEWIGKERGFWRGVLDEGRSGMRGRGWWGGGKGCEGRGRWSGEH